MLIEGLSPPGIEGVVSGFFCTVEFYWHHVATSTLRRVSPCNSSKFRVVHLSTSDVGGAAIAARRLNYELNREGIESTFYAFSRQGYHQKENEFEIPRRCLIGFLGAFSTLISKFLTGISFYSLFSFPGISLRKVRAMAAGEKTVLHLHNWFNLLSQRQLARLINSKIPLVLTMHDQRFMTGGCHYALGCNQYKTGCHSCPATPQFLHWFPKRNVRRFQILFSAPKDTFKIVSPSYFMIAKAHESKSLQNFSVEFIPNVLPNFFSASIKRGSPKAEATFLVGVASANPNDLIKGGDFIQMLQSDQELRNEGVSFAMLAEYPVGAEYKFWQSIDCLLVPSRADNSPNVIHEAKSLGIPVITSNAGGIPELTTEGFDIVIELENLSHATLISAINSIQNGNKSKVSFNKSKLDHQLFGDGAIARLVDIYNSTFVNSK